MNRFFMLGIIGLFITGFLNAQNYSGNLAGKPVVAVLNIDSKGILLDPEQLGNLTRLELEKTNIYSVMDKYDMFDKIEKNKIDFANCYGKNCLVGIGITLQTDKILTGSVERYDEKIIITLRLVNIKANIIEQTVVNEYLNLQPEIQKMIEISVRNLLNLSNNQEEVTRLIKEFNFESATTNPGVTKIILNGPRMGFSYVSGEKGRRLQSPKSQGGWEVYPYLTQFGYQHEIQYLNEGSFQAVVEFIPMISGIDQGLILPSFTFLNGLRNNKWGFEFAFGPNIGIARKAMGYYEEGKWKREGEWVNGVDTDGNPLVKPEMLERYDRRGKPIVTSGFVWAVGKTFKSGHLNIPVNAYIAPSKEGWYMGVTFGFNSKNRSN